MSAELERYKQEVMVQKEQLIVILAHIGLDSEFDFEFTIPDEGSPLSDLFVAAKMAAENMGLIATQRAVALERAEKNLRIIEGQSRSILELSTPVIEILPQILILPLIGTIDTQRAQRVIENLLETIVQTQATVAIMDITGVPVIDTAVANHLLQTTEAARMLGADVILSGVSAHNAQTLAKLGVDLGQLKTTSSLRSALKLALKITNRKIVENNN